MSLPFLEEGETLENLTQSIHTPVNKPREAQSLRELPALGPSGGAQSFWPWYYYTIILYYIGLLLYKELRESQTATITFSSMLQFTPDCTALSWPVERWLAVTLHMSLSGHAVERRLAVITRMSRQSLNIFEDWLIFPKRVLYSPVCMATGEHRTFFGKNGEHRTRRT